MTNQADFPVKKQSCPISNQEVFSDTLSLEYKGERYVFCCTHCRARFIEEFELEFIQATAAECSVTDNVFRPCSVERA